MTTSITDYPNVSQKIADLGCKYPIGFALLPVNFESATSIAAFRQLSEAATVRTLFRAAGIPQDDIVDRSRRPPYIQNNHLEWVVPTLFVSAALWSENQGCVAIALSVIANYATDFLKGMGGGKGIRMDIVVEKTKSKTCKKISYKGDAEGLKGLAEVIRATSDE